MKTSILLIGKRPGRTGWRPAGAFFSWLRLSPAAALLAVFLLSTALGGCAHRELLAPCSDYRDGYAPAALSGQVPCDSPLQMHRPPWLTASQEPPASPQEG